MRGCELPESLRQYYLDTLGITNWRLQQPAPAEVDAAVDMVADTLNDQAPLDTAPVAGNTEDASVAQDDDWRELQQAVSQCHLCEELAQSRTQTVFGVGNRQADVLVIGEAPGRDEDAQGEPFVGRAGQLLNAMLAAIDLPREQVFIANILKCRPPNNRDPSPQEAQNCRAFLQRQIALIQPKVIFVVGRIAAQNLLDTDLAIGKMRGRDYQYQDENIGPIPVIVTYHPAYLLRQPGEKRKSWQDLLRLRALMQSW